MANSVTYPITAKEIVTGILRLKGIHEGIWSLGVKFDFVAINTEVNNKPLAPGALSTIDSYFLELADQVTALSVDAAVANPSSPIIHPFERH